MQGAGVGLVLAWGFSGVPGDCLNCVVAGVGNPEGVEERCAGGAAPLATIVVPKFGPHGHVGDIAESGGLLLSRLERHGDL